MALKLIRNGEDSRMTNRALDLIFILCLVLIFVIRLQYFISAESMTDSDQPFLWLGAKDYSEGKFYEPRFYGQDYNTFLESLVAVPLIWQNIPPFYALPAATHFIFLFPFIFSAVFLFAARRKISAILVLLTLLCCTPAFDILTSIPRGFVTGMFFCSFFVISLLDPHSLKYYIINGILLLTGIFVNPNCMIAGVPFLVYMFMHHYRSGKFYLTSLIFIPVYFLLYLIFDKFYDDHPEYVVYQLMNDYGWGYFRDHLNNLDDTFAHINFFQENKCLWTLAAFLVLGITFYRQKSRPLLAGLLVLVVFILLTFFSGKTREGSTWPFYSLSRIYMVLPFTIALLAAMVRLRSSKIFAVAAILLLVYPLQKIIRQKENLTYHTQESHFLGVHIVPVRTAVDAMTVYRRYCKKNNAEYLMISNIFWLCTFLNYGGSSIYNDFPQTQETWADRRYWVWHHNREKVHERFLILSINNRFDEVVAGRYPFETEKLDDYGLFLIKNNKMKDGDFIKVFESVETQ